MTLRNSAGGSVFSVKPGSVFIINQQVLIYQISVNLLDKAEEHSFSMNRDKAYDTLINSIRKDGILRPLLVEKHTEDNHYTVLSGMRRLMAAKDLNMTEIPCVIIDPITSLDRSKIILFEYKATQRNQPSLLECAILANYYDNNFSE